MMSIGETVAEIWRFLKMAAVRQLRVLKLWNFNSWRG